MAGSYTRFTMRLMYLQVLCIVQRFFNFHRGLTWDKRLGISSKNSKFGKNDIRQGVSYVVGRVANRNDRSVQLSEYRLWTCCSENYFKSKGSEISVGHERAFLCDVKRYSLILVHAYGRKETRN